MANPADVSPYGAVARAFPTTSIEHRTAFIRTAMGVDRPGDQTQKLLKTKQCQQKWRRGS
jgi:hypothetical protein